MTILSTQIAATTAASAKIIESTKKIENVLKEKDKVAFLLYASLLEKSLKETEEDQIDLTPATDYDFSLLRNYDECLESVHSLKYHGVKVLQARFQASNKTTEAVIDRNVLRYEARYEEQDLRRQQLNKHQQRRLIKQQMKETRRTKLKQPIYPSKQQPFLQISRSPIPYPCVALVNDALVEGYNYVEFRIISGSYSPQNVSSVVLGICYSPSDPALQSDINQSECLWQLVQIQVNQFSRSRIQQAPLVNNPIYRCLIRLEGKCGPGEISILKQMPESYVTETPSCAPAIDAFGHGFYKTVASVEDQSGLLGVYSISNPTIQPISPIYNAMVRVDTGSEHAGNTGNLYVAFCLDTPDYSIEVMESPTMCSNFSPAMFNLG
ncbi:uncharacterized protein [Amphiura filiformis]|uniref:uncharacterized protein n=1 Tax=Amphiura filiformis TaxID=82378 RepID=UPI003B211822